MLYMQKRKTVVYLQLIMATSHVKNSKNDERDITLEAPHQRQRASKTI